VDRDVQPAFEQAIDLFAKGIDGIFIREVGGAGVARDVRSLCDRVGGRAGSCFGARDDADRRAAAGKPLGHGSPETCRTANDDGGGAGEIKRIRSLHTRPVLQWTLGEGGATGRSSTREIMLSSSLLSISNGPAMAAPIVISMAMTTPPSS